MFAWNGIIFTNSFPFTYVQRACGAYISSDPQHFSLCLSLVLLNFYFFTAQGTRHQSTIRVWLEQFIYDCCIFTFPFSFFFFLVVLFRVAFVLSLRIIQYILSPRKIFMVNNDEMEEKKMSNVATATAPAMLLRIMYVVHALEHTPLRRYYHRLTMWNVPATKTSMATTKSKNDNLFIYFVYASLRY